MNESDPEKASVRLKGVGKNLCVMLDPLCPVETLQEEITRLFSDLKRPTRDARVTLDVGPGSEHDALIETLSEFLTRTFGVGSVSRAEKKKTAAKRSAGAEEWHRKRDMAHSWQNYPTDVLLLTGRVRSGQRVTARKHLVLLGDVNPGGEVFAGGDILILGTLLGIAIAGQPENEDHIILALDFRPAQIQIGSYVAAGAPSSPGKMTEYAHVENGSIVVESYLEANPFGRLPWPRVR